MNVEHYAILRSGVSEWNAWRKENPNVVPDLSKCDLVAYSLPGINLGGANLAGVILSCVNLSGASLNYADLTGADLAHANLTNASLFQSIGTFADFSFSTCTETIFREATLIRSCFDSVRATMCSFKYANLHKVHAVRSTFIKCDLSNSDLSKCCFNSATFDRCDLQGCNLFQTDLTSTHVINASIQKRHFRLFRG